MDLFARYTDMLVDCRPGDKEKVQKALLEAKRVKNGPKIVASIYQGLCGVHALPANKEREAFESVVSALGA